MKPLIDAKGQEFLNRLDAVIRRHSMLKHRFYQLWNQGELDLKILADYARQYYAQVRAFPAYVSGVHSHCDDLDVRRLLLENLIEEEHGVDNHPELWLRFADSLGVSRETVGSTKLLPSTEKSVQALKAITQSENYLEGLAALYAYESQIPEVSCTKREGLRDFYGITNERAVSFFTVHEVADIEHRQIERDILSQQAITPEMQTRVLNAAETAAKALWLFLDGVFEAYVAPKFPAATATC